MMKSYGRPFRGGKCDEKGDFANSAPRWTGRGFGEGDLSTYEFTPFVSPDGRYLYFSRGWREMWRIPIAEVKPLLDVVQGR
jgi:hypothetical protein